MEVSDLKNNSGQNQAKKYNKILLQLKLIGLFLSIVFLLILIFSNGSLSLRQVIENINSNSWFVVGGYLIVFFLATEALSFPLAYFRGYLVEHRFELSTQKFNDWLKDWIKGIVVNLILGLFIGEIFYFILRTYPEWWWLISAGVFSLIFIILTNLAPVVLMPIFFKFKPLEKEELKQRLLTLTEETRIKVRGVYEMDLSRKSKTANAGLTGLGNTRRIILSDTLLEKFSNEEIESVFAHELGHHQGRHIWRLIAFQSLTTVIAFFVAYQILNHTISYLPFRNVSDVAAFPLLLLIIFLISLIFLPLANAYSRKLEKRADYFALIQTDHPENFISALEKLAKLNLADKNPHPLIEFLFYSHPSIRKRMRYASEFLNSKF
ncbi:MAG: M48 family metallopeptidase [Candidatus Aminicenantia bacterium]